MEETFKILNRMVEEGAIDGYAPRTLEELRARKELARRRFDDMPILEKMEMAIRMHRDMTRMLRPATPKAD